MVCTELQGHNETESVRLGLHCHWQQSRQRVDHHITDPVNLVRTDAITVKVTITVYRNHEQQVRNLICGGEIDLITRIRQLAGELRFYCSLTVSRRRIKIHQPRRVQYYGRRFERRSTSQHGRDIFGQQLIGGAKRSGRVPKRAVNRR